MLWLAGMMGLMAVGAVTYVEIGAVAAEEEDTLPEGTEPDMRSTDTQLSTPGDILSGTEGAERLTGDTGDDQIGGYDGNDVVIGGAGSDDLHGHEGNDTLDGATGADSLHGGDGDDDLFGGAGNDSLAGQNDDDLLHGGAGDDVLQGSAGDDLLYGDAGNDALQGGLGDDALAGGSGEDSLFGGWGDDTLTGLEAAEEAQNGTLRDYLNGGGGDDVIVAGPQDIVTAGAGVDQIVLGDWIAAGAATEIMDYNAEEDSLLFVWNDETGEDQEPPLSVMPDPLQSGQTLVMLDQTVIARVAGDSLSLDDIALIPLSAAFDLGLAA
ncbi:calcium-binding protein [Sulfitobacter sp. S0837]|uniref:calcium-binding protein n=1 Tax=Sulfitobacter maritimus TaxID=2741719 RepID=UPI001581A440|nr:calcium-binding protein [Sulfitobacter maritimus]NUH65376.1 calcium-binding protein [Sulfitobacter maritimus]